MTRRISSTPGFMELLFPYALSKQFTCQSPRAEHDWYRDHNAQQATEAERSRNKTAKAARAPRLSLKRQT